MKTKRGIIYVNFSPYDNAGRILDFLKRTCTTVIHFSYDHLRLKNGRRTNILTIYRNGNIVEQKRLVPLRTPEFLRFLSLPGVALLILLQTYYYCRKAQETFGPIEWYFTVNAYTAWVGNILKRLGVVKKTIFWVWDYFPPGYPDWRIRLLRRVYWRFDRPAVLASDVIACISEHLIRLRHDSGILSKNHPYRIIPIGTTPRRALPKKPPSLILGFMGMLKTSQGIDFIIDVLPNLIRRYKRVRLEIIGSGPQETEFKARAKRYADCITFHGYIEKETDVDRIMRRWSIGLATYVPTPSNESYWTDPSKIKAYLSQGIPVITTNVPTFAQELSTCGAGIIVPYGDGEALVHAVQTILRHHKTYRANALKLAKRYTYRKLYTSFFT